MPARPPLCDHRGVTTAAGNARYACASCGRDRTAADPALPCACGSYLRQRVDTLDVYGRPATVDTPRWDPLKDWTAKYLQLAWNVGNLRRLSTGDSAADADEVRTFVDMSLASAVRLGEWLTSGPEPASVTPGDVARLLDTEPLAVCAAVATPDGPRSARVLPVAFVRPPRYWVEYRRPYAKPVRYDALDLAERSLRTWQTFLSLRGVPLPSWQ